MSGGRQTGSFPGTPLLYLGVFLTSSAALLLEVSLTRLFSVILWHHFAFMVVSMALLGYGASGSLLMGPLAPYPRRAMLTTMKEKWCQRITKKRRGRGNM